MFTPIQDEMKLLIKDIQTELNTLIIEHEDINNPNMYNEYSGGIKQLNWIKERVEVTTLNINDIITNIMKNAADGNYSAKMEILERENQLLRDKIDLFEEQVKTIDKNLDRANKLRISKKKIKTEKDNIEENLEL